ncbi:MAG: GNAT family N-acetyltransferase [Deltaproteobacteria bacterium]|jgi:putative beta-lysine N-acetyltransferase|nr:GNAT family N-acetyltransferase [Deltaproteobacteria bacterium]MBW2534776.1 GNAT family N-acetyltransferase [Deltaproteobacteria bacterium]
MTEPSSIDRLPPDDPTPRWRTIELRTSDQAFLSVKDDAYSDRIRCDHPPECSPSALATALVEAAQANGRGRIALFAPAPMRDGLVQAGFVQEATMPGFYAGTEDCVVLGKAIDPARAELADPDAVADADAILKRKTGSAPPEDRPTPATVRATESDAPAIAELVTRTFDRYPTPTGVPEYVAGLIRDGIPFRIVREGDDVVACASADLIRSARTAELTDCATRPDQRGRGLMQGILSDLMDDMRAMGYPTAFTLARASVPGINLAFWRLGFVWRGQMRSSCRIGGGIEDMNVWSRPI